MAISEAQLDIWAKQGSVTQSQATYATVRNCLEASDAPYAGRSKSIFLQGSYGNDTNIYADSDVDVVIVTDSVFYHSDNDLSPDEQTAIRAVLKGGGGYSYSQFKTEVLAQLTKKFGSAVERGKKAIFVKGEGNRRDADVLPAVEFRRYTRFKTYTDSDFHEGITFWTTDGVQIINYPKHHSANATAKHQATTSWYKPTVRIFKNMRNAMIAKGYLAEGVSPSYFLEGMLYNVPNNLFGQTYANTCANALNWLHKCDRNKLVCANERYYLLRTGDQVCWNPQDFETYLAAVIKFWNAS
ncbi:MAG: nucleotidyltransferase domain-containing protein [Caulobacteraceae bacterium]